MQSLSPKKKFYLFGALLISFILVALFLNINQKTKSIFVEEGKPLVKGADNNNYQAEFAMPVLINDKDDEWRGTSYNTELNEIAEDLKVTYY